MKQLVTDNLNHAQRGRSDDVVSAEIVLRGMLSLASQLETLHQNGQVHRDVSMQTVAVDWMIPRVELHADVSLAAMAFGGLLADPERCPPELRRSHPCDVPADLEAARRVLASHGILAGPERIDLYQLGTLLCRLITGRSILAYLSSPGVLFRVPARVRRVIDGCIGYDDSQCVESASQLIELLNEALGAPAVATLARAWDESPKAHVLANVATKDTQPELRAETRIHLRRPPFERLGHFEIHEEIGHGGMGTVYRAYDRSLDRVVAVKVLSQRLAADPTFVQRFQAEAAAAARLTHPNVVPIYFIGEEAGSHFYAMRLINGESLADRLHREPSISASEVLVILQQVLLGLAAAHRLGLVHRDIKPGNILIDRENGLATLTDFGLARSTSKPHDQSDHQLVMGTVEYMSPEQAQGEPADPRSDLYSVGVLLYQLLSGEMPFEADTPSSHLIHHVCTEPRPLREVIPDVDPQLDAVVTRLLRKRPDERYPSVEELLIDLDAAMESVFAGSNDPARPMINVRSTRSSRIRRTSSDVLRLANQTAGAGRPANSGSVNNVASAAIAMPVKVKSPNGRRSAVLVMAGLLVVLIAVATARFQQPVGATTLQAHQDAVSALAFSPDGNWLLSGGGVSSSLKAAGDTSLRLWNAHTGQLVKQSERLPVRPRHLLFLADSHRAIALASAREDAGTLLVWDSHQGTLGPTDFSEPFAMHFAAASLTSADGDQQLLIAGRNGLTRVTVDGVVARTSPAKLSLNSSLIRAMAVCQTPSGSQIIIAVNERDGAAIVSFDWESGRELTRRTCDFGVITALAACHGGRCVVTRTTETLSRPHADRNDQVPDLPADPKSAFDFVRVWDWSNQTERFRFGPYTPGSRALAVSLDGRRALTIAEPSIGSRSDVPQEAVCIDLTAGEEICRLHTNSKSLTAVALSPSGSRAALADADGQVVFCDLP